MKHIYAILALFIFALLAIIYRGNNNSSAFSEYPKIKVIIGSKTYTLHVADTPERHSRGLSSIPSMKRDEGMIFIFDQADYHGFWMKKMNFPLDFIFVDGSQVVDTLENIKPETYPQAFMGSKPYNTVIELNEEEIKISGLKLGDRILYK